MKKRIKQIKPILKDFRDHGKFLFQGTRIDMGKYRLLRCGRSCLGLKGDGLRHFLVQDCLSCGYNYCDIRQGSGFPCRMDY